MLARGEMQFVVFKNKPVPITPYSLTITSEYSFHFYPSNFFHFLCFYDHVYFGFHRPHRHHHYCLDHHNLCVYHRNYLNF